MRVVLHEVNTSSNSTSPENTPWIEYWKKQTQIELPQECPCCGKNKNEDDFVGAHVINLYELLDANKKRYITPTCSECNNRYKYSKAKDHPFIVEERMLLQI